MKEERTTSRRRFLGTAAGATGVALAAAAWKPAQAAAAVPDTGRGTQSPTAVERRFRPGVFALTLEGAGAGILKAIDGGDAYAEVVTIQPGSGGFPIKSITNVKYDDFAVQLGFEMTKAVYDWINASWKMKSHPETGLDHHRGLQLRGEERTPFPRRAHQRSRLSDARWVV